MKTKENKVLFAVCNNYGKYTRGTVIMIDNVPYILDDGYCEDCDLGKDCFRKPFSCSDDLASEDICLKKLKGGI